MQQNGDAKFAVGNIMRICAKRHNSRKWKIGGASRFGAVGRAVYSGTRHQRFKSNHWQFYLLALETELKRRKKEKEAGNGQIRKGNSDGTFSASRVSRNLQIRKVFFNSFSSGRRVSFGGRCCRRKVSLFG